MTKTQSARSAYRSITSKYKTIKDQDKFYHRRNGNWTKYSLKEDRARNVILTRDEEALRQEPYRYDMRGKDTKKNSRSLLQKDLQVNSSFLKRSNLNKRKLGK